MRALYSFGISLYGLGVRIAALFGHQKARLMVSGWQKLYAVIPDFNARNEKVAWFHASSLGEFEQARPILEEYRKRYPEYKICLSFFSPSGFEIRKNYEMADFVCYLPLDTRYNAREFVRLVNPSVAFFVKYDHWFNLLHELKKHNIPTYLFSAIFRPSQYFFKWYGHWFLRQLRCYNHIFVQNEESVALLRKHHVDWVSQAGDSRFDRVHQIAKNVQSFPEVERFLANLGAGTKVLLAGSSWEPDEAFLQEYLHHIRDSFALILAPHEIHESHLRSIENLFAPYGTVRFSDLSSPLSGQRVLIVDNFGKLSSLYQYADIAYIGGGFGKGIHNTLEAMTFAKPVIFGPNYQKFKEARDIIERGGGKSFSTYIELEKILNLWLHDKGAADLASNACRQYVEENLGTTEKVLEKV